jgi:hypothetical protein
VDVSPLIDVVTISSETHDIPCKRMVYAIMTAIARKDPDITLLITNSLLKDCSSDNPIIAGMALRAICDIEVTAIHDELPKIVARGLKDTNPYVRRMAVLATIHLQKVHPEAIEDRGITARLYELLYDRDPQIVCNSLFALSALLKNQGGVVFSEKLIHQLANSLGKFSEWAQSEAMQVISQFRPSTDQERYDVMNIVDPYLSSSSAAVLTSAAKILLTMTNEKADLQRQVTQRLLPKFITHIHAAGPELQFCLLKHLIVLARRFPTCFKAHLPHFYVNFTDIPSVARAKFELMEITADIQYARDIVETTARYVLLEKPFTIPPGIKLMRDLALRIPAAIQIVCKKFRLFFDMKRHHLINECLVVLPDLMRRLPISLPDFISLLPSEPPSELSGPALAAYAWILGEYGERITDSDYYLEHLMRTQWSASEPAKSSVSSTLPSAHDEQSMLKICLITSLAKLLFVTPGEARPVLAAALAVGIRDAHPAVRDRAQFVYNLLRTQLDAARAALLSTKENMAAFVEDADAENVDMVFDEFNTFSVVYGKPQCEWKKDAEEVTLEIEEEEEAAESEHKLQELEPITAEDFQALWTSDEIVESADSVSLGFSLDLGSFVEALNAANVGVMAQGNTDGGGLRIFAYGYVDGDISLIEANESQGEMSFTIKAGSEETVEQFKDFWIGMFNE